LRENEWRLSSTIGGPRERCGSSAGTLPAAAAATRRADSRISSASAPRPSEATASAAATASADASAMRRSAACSAEEEEEERRASAGVSKSGRAGREALLGERRAADLGSAACSVATLAASASAASGGGRSPAAAGLPSRFSARPEALRRRPPEPDDSARARRPCEQQV